MRFFNMALVMALVFCVFIYKHNQKMHKLKKTGTQQISAQNNAPKLQPTERAAFNKLDIVAISKGQGAQTGLSEHIAIVGGVTYYFSSPENLQAFKQSPASFKPQFNGLGTLYLAQGYEIPGKPEYGAAYNNKIFFFSNAQNLGQWHAQPLRIHQMAQAKWREIQSQKKQK